MKEHFILSRYLKASKTFAIYQDLFSQMTLEHSYSPIEISTKDKSRLAENEIHVLTEFIRDFKANPNAVSIVVSDPFKQIITSYCDDFDPRARQLNAVNLIVKKGENLVGSNIDGEAFFLGQKETINFDFHKKTILVLGCGGVSTAVAFTLAGIGAKSIHLFDTRSEREKILAERLRSFFPKLSVIELPRLDNSSLSRADVIYNGTGIGKESDNPNYINESPLSNLLTIPESVLAIDANYTPWKTKFLQQFDQMGSQTLNGFSHMTAFIALHLSTILATEIAVGTVREIGKKHVQEGIELR